MRVVSRFAPSPTGYLHLGHAYSALTAWRFARERGGRFVLRIEDIDPTRCRPEYEAAILEDLEWLGVDWDGVVWRQSERMTEYAAALAALRGLDVVYPDDRTRRQIEAGRPPRPAAELLAEPRVRVAWRLDMKAAIARTGCASRTGSAATAWTEVEAGRVEADPSPHGDVILARKDTPTSYHLAVTVDDAAQGVTHVVRGRDLYESTPVHRLLQDLLGIAPPVYHHHGLVKDPATGRRYAKRDGSVTLRHLRAEGVTPAQVRERVGLTA